MGSNQFYSFTESFFDEVFAKGINNRKLVIEIQLRAVLKPGTIRSMTSVDQVTYDKCDEIKFKY
jgi:hypothetical protein